jgi:hypothetical protein
MKPFQKDAYTSQEPFWKVSSLHMILLGRYIVLVAIADFGTEAKFSLSPRFWSHRSERSCGPIKSCEAMKLSRKMPN